MAFPFFRRCYTSYRWFCYCQSETCKMAF